MNNVIVEQQVERVDKAKTQSTTERKQQWQRLNNSHRFCKLLSFVTFWSNTNIDVLIHISAIRPGGTVQKLFGTSLSIWQAYSALPQLGRNRVRIAVKRWESQPFPYAPSFRCRCEKILLCKLRIAKNRNVVCFAQYQVLIYLQHRLVRT